MKRLNPATGKPFRRGDVREDGYKFQHYQQKTIKADGHHPEVWLSPEAFDRMVKRSSANAAAWRRRNPDRCLGRELTRNYGITEEDYRVLLAKQSGRCAICGTERCPTGRRLCVDHCHATGSVRGLLCAECNFAIGKLNDDPERLIRAAEYLTAGGSK